MAGLDPHAAAAVESLVANDDQFKSYVKKLATKALQTQLYYLENGTPDVQVRIAEKFIPIFTKALTGQDGDKQTADMHQEVRNMISSVIQQVDTDEG